MTILARVQAAQKGIIGEVPWQRYQFHILQTALAYVSRDAKNADVPWDIRTKLNATDIHYAHESLKQTVTKYKSIAPKFAGWMETAIPESLTVMLPPEGLLKRLRTSNGIERSIRNSGVDSK